MTGTLGPFHFLLDDHGAFYGPTSGWLGLVLGLGFLGTWWHHHICHERRCIRKGRHPAADGLYVVCRRHHPDVPDDGPTAGHIADAHAAHVERRRRSGLP